MIPVSEFAMIAVCVSVAVLLLLVAYRFTKG